MKVHLIFKILIKLTIIVVVLANMIIINRNSNCININNKISLHNKSNNNRLIYKEKIYKDKNKILMSLEINLVKEEVGALINFKQ